MRFLKQQGSDTATRGEFRHSVQVLDAIASWQMWSSGIMILLPPVMILLLSFPSVDATWLVRVLLGLIWIGSVVMLYRQLRCLKLVREDLIVQTDVATRYRVRGEQYYGLSILDPLTGLYNRRFGEARLQEEIKRAQESGDPLLVLAFDFDRFKEINDKHGHASGDLALKEFSRRLQRAVRSCDVPTRIGGDEFFVVLPECPPEKFEMILSRMGSITVTHDGNQIPVCFSFGTAQYQADDTVETLIKRADERLYAEKAKRKAADRLAEESANVPATGDDDSNVPARSQSPARMRRGRVRRSARIPRELSILLIGNDLDGKGFLEETNTIEVSQHGARIVSRHKLGPEQEIIVRRDGAAKESEARIVRVIDSHSESYTYGAALVGPSVDLWDVECPRLAGSENEAIPSLFECSGCEGRERVEDGEHAPDGHELVRSCKRCGSATTWNRVLNDEIQRESRVEASGVTVKGH